VDAWRAPKRIFDAQTFPFESVLPSVAFRNRPRKVSVDLPLIVLLLLRLDLAEELVVRGAHGITAGQILPAPDGCIDIERIEFDSAKPVASVKKGSQDNNVVHTFTRVSIQSAVRQNPSAKARLVR
jgi:hypothetical protein